MEYSVINLIVSIFSALFGGAGAFVSLKIIFKKPHYFKDFQQYIEKEEIIPGFEKTYEYHHFLDLSLKFVPFILEKIKRRFIVLLIYIFSSGFITGLDFDSGNLSNLPSFLEIYDLVIYLSYIIIYIFLRTNLIVNATEREFLRNYQYLFDRFYKNVITPKLNEINSIVWTMHSKGIKKYLHENEEKNRKYLKGLEARVKELEEEK